MNSSPLDSPLHNCSLVTIVLCSGHTVTIQNSKQIELLHCYYTLYNTLLLNTTQYIAITHYTIQCYYTLYNTLLLHIIQYIAITHYTIHCYYTLYNTLLLHTIQYIAITHYTIHCYYILHKK